MSAQGRIRLRLLGGFSATNLADSRPIVLASPRHRALLAYLALQPEFSESRERLVTLLWGDSPEADARKRFRQSLMRLRRELEEAGVAALAGERDVLGLDPAAVAADAREFLALQADNAADLGRALDLYRGDLLDGLDLDSEGFGEWLREQRTRVRNHATQLFARAVAVREREGDTGGAIEAAERLVALDPADEATQRRLIELIARYRGKSAALAQAEAARRYVREEFDSELEPETLRLIASLRTSTPAQAELAAAGPARSAVVPVTDMPRTSQVESAPDLPKPRFPLRRLWLPAAALVAICAISAIGFLRWSGVDTATGAVRIATAQDPGWGAPDPAVPSVAVSKAVQGRGLTALMVLPFAAEPGNDAPATRLAGLISSDLTNDLSHVPNLRVISRTTALQYARQPVDVVALGHELGVHYVVEGDVRLEDKKVRVNIALIDTKSRLQAWSQRYERDEADRGAVQEEIVRGLARQLQVSLMEIRGRTASNNPNVDALLVRGWAALNLYAFFRGGDDGAQLFQSVLDLDPQNTSAMTGLGAFKSVTYAVRQNPRDNEAGLREAEALLRKAQELAPQGSLPPYFLGRNLMYRGRRDEALALFARALELNPSYAPAYGSIGFVLLHTRRLQEALDNLMYAIRLSPKDHYMGLWSEHVGRIHFELGDLDEAERWLTQAVALTPNAPINRSVLAALYAYRGNVAAANAQIAKVKELKPGITLSDMITRVTMLCKEDSDRPQRLIAGLNKAMATGNAY